MRRGKIKRKLLSGLSETVLKKYLKKSSIAKVRNHSNANLMIFFVCTTQFEVVQHEMHVDTIRHPKTLEHSATTLMSLTLTLS